MKTINYLKHFKIFTQWAQKTASSFLTQPKLTRQLWWDVFKAAPISRAIALNKSSWYFFGSTATSKTVHPPQNTSWNNFFSHTLAIRENEVSSVPCWYNPFHCNDLTEVSWIDGNFRVISHLDRTWIDYLTPTSWPKRSGWGMVCSPQRAVGSFHWGQNLHLHGALQCAANHLITRNISEVNVVRQKHVNLVASRMTCERNEGKQMKIATETSIYVINRTGDVSVPLELLTVHSYFYTIFNFVKTYSWN